MRKRFKLLANIAQLVREKKVIFITALLVVLFLVSTSLLYAIASDETLETPEPIPAQQDNDSDVETEIPTEPKAEKPAENEQPPSQQEPQVEPEESSSTALPLLVLVNKHNAINPIDYVPPNLVSPSVTKRSGATVDARVADALKEMFDDASQEGLTLMMSNGYRSYSTQKTLYNNYVQQDGQNAADTYSARPGHSEHQTGLAVDIIVPSGTCSLEQCFGDLPEGKWLSENAHDYGFIIRYTKTNKSEAGYTYEPWHLRYIGRSDAIKYHSQNASSLEDYLGRPAAPDYL